MAKDLAKSPGQLNPGQTNLTDLAKEVHAQNVTVGWWDGWLEDKHSRHETAMMLAASELAEAMEGERKDLMDDHLPHRKMFDVELADAAIRLLDLAGAYEMDLSHVSIWQAKYLPEIGRRSRVEQLYFVCSRMLGYWGDEAQVSAGLAGVLAMAHVAEIDLMFLIQEKREYNAQRADHKREARAADGGKKF